MKHHISIQFFATLSPFTPANHQNYPVDDGATVMDVLKELNVPVKDIRLVFVNGVKGEFSSILQNGDRIGVFPPVGGG
jgi:molybdopterin converting factor small subunit